MTRRLFYMAARIVVQQMDKSKSHNISSEASERRGRRGRSPPQCWNHGGESIFSPPQYFPTFLHAVSKTSTLCRYVAYIQLKRNKLTIIQLFLDDFITRNDCLQHTFALSNKNHWVALTLDYWHTGQVWTESNWSKIEYSATFCLVFTHFVDDFLLVKW